jgi:hypothetical protein
VKRILSLVFCLVLTLAGHAVAGVVGSRADLNSLLASSAGWEARTENFELLDVNSSATWFGTTLDSDTTIGVYGPGMVMSGLTFHSDAFNIVHAGQTPLFLSSNAMGGQLATYSLPTLGTPWLEIVFDEPTNAFGYDWRTNNAWFDSARVQVYRDQTLLYDSGSIGAFDAWRFFGYKDAGGIDRVRISNTANSSGWYIASPLLDNLTFGAVPSAVPIPGALLLLAPGIAALVAARRRIRK